MDSIPPGRLLTLVRPGNDLVLRRIRNLKISNPSQDEVVSWTDECQEPTRWNRIHLGNSLASNIDPWLILVAAILHQN